MADKTVQVDLLNVQRVKDMLAHAEEEIGRLRAEDERLSADYHQMRAELAQQRACHDMDVRSMLRMQGTITTLSAEVRTCTEVARIAQGHADKFKADRDAAIEHLAAANAEIDHLKTANANLIRNAEILADEIVLGTTATFGAVSDGR